MTSTISRRHALQALAMIGTISRSVHADKLAPARPSGGAPTAFVQLVLPGGMDAILTTDPKIKSDLAKDRAIDLPYAEDKITRVGSTNLGPLFAPIARFVPKMAIVNGVQCSTVAHTSGHLQIQQMRRLFH